MKNNYFYKVVCEFNCGVGYQSIWDKKSDAIAYFEDAFEEYKEKTNMSFQEALETEKIKFVKIKKEN